MRDARFFIRRTPYHQSVTIDFGVVNPDGSVCKAQPVQMKVCPPSDGLREIEDPMLEISSGGGEIALQSLMDELWQIGIRPKDIGTAGHLTATQSHLSDMRALVSKLAEVKLP